MPRWRAQPGNRLPHRCRPRRFRRRVQPRAMTRARRAADDQLKQCSGGTLVAQRGLALPGSPRTTSVRLRPARTSASSPSGAPHCSLRPRNITRRTHVGGLATTLEPAPHPGHRNSCGLRGRATSLAVTCWPPVAVNRTASPVVRAPAPLSVTVSRGTNKCTKGASGSVIVSPGRRRVACSAVYLFLIKLSVTGGDGAFVGHHPHLHEVHGLGVLGSALHPPGVVLFRVQDSGAGAHTLGEPRVDDPGVTGGAPGGPASLQHPGQDLHVLVGVRLEPGARTHDVVVVDHSRP